jgi:acyl-CoA synthetase (AMP-forming)/AMP-acid ligase II
MTEEVRVGCIGRPYTAVEVVLRAPDGTPVADGEIGELTIRSEHMMQGYWGMPEQTAEVLREGWLWSGDLGRRDAEGFITLVGRTKDMLISGGFNIYPTELEAVLTRHPEILEASVVGVPDNEWGEAAVAVVVRARNSTLTSDALREWCKPVLGFRTPKRVLFANELPKNSAGKVDKKRVRATVLAQEKSDA